MATVIWYLTPESPRWLLETDQHEESEKVLRQIARQNGQDLEKSDFSSKFAELTSRHASAPHGWPLLDVAAFGLGHHIFLRQISTIKSHDGGKEGYFGNHKVNSYHLQSTRSAQPPGQLSL